MTIERVPIADCRYYSIDDGSGIKYYPSVTTILGKTGDNSWIKEWHARIGKDKADAISTFSANRGTCMHLYNENYIRLRDEKHDPQNILKHTIEISNKELMSQFTVEEINVGKNLFFNFYNSKAFNKIKRPIIQETYLYSELGGGYAGTVDLIYEDEFGNHIVADFKSSKKPKDIKDIISYKKQLSAYFIAYYQRTGNIPHSAEIWISNEYDFTPQIIKLDYETIKVYFKLFIEDVRKFHNMYDPVLKEFLQQ